jgi:two-component system, sensor histidine kinase YesM
MFLNWSLKKKFATVFLVLISLPTILFGILIYYQATEAFKNQAEENINSRQEKNVENLTSIIRGIENMSSYMIYDENFRTFFTTPHEDVQTIRQSEEAIRGYFTFQLMSYDYINSIELASNDGNTLTIGNPVSGNEVDLEVEAIKKQGAPHWSNYYKVDSPWNGTHGVITLTRVINDINNISQPVGLIKIRLDESKLYQTIEVDPSQQGEYFIMSNKGDVVLHRNSSLAGKPFPDSNVKDLVIKSEKKTVTYKTEDHTFLLVKKRIEDTNWLSVVLVNQEEVVRSLYNVRLLVLNMIILLALLGIVAFIGFYYWHIKPIIELTEQTKQLEKGDFTAKVQINSQDEIGKLGTRFNKMVITIQKYIDIEYRLKIKQTESELKALQNQIDPHFLYNTLDMIRWTARIENALETGQLIERLSKIFRMNLNMGKMWISLEEEMIYLQNYLELQRSRMGDRLQFTIFYEDQVKEACIIKQVIQPLIENSIIHGFKDLPKQGKICIRCYKVDQELWIDIIDNGWGFESKDDVSKEKKVTGYALINIKERMRIVFGERFGMEQRKTEEGT